MRLRDRPESVLNTRESQLQLQSFCVVMGPPHRKFGSMKEHPAVFLTLTYIHRCFCPLHKFNRNFQIAILFFPLERQGGGMHIFCFISYFYKLAKLLNIFHCHLHDQTGKSNHISFTSNLVNFLESPMLLLQGQSAFLNLKVLFT